MSAASPHRPPPMPLYMLRPGGRSKVVSVNAGCDLGARMTALGVIPGVEVEMIRNDERGGLVLSVKGSRIMVGHGMAQKIFVS